MSPFVAQPGVAFPGNMQPGLAGSGVLTILTTSLPGATIGVFYTQTLAAAGGTNSGYVWTLLSGSLPGGLSLSSGGVISGTPSALGTFSFTVKVTDSGSNTATQALSIVVSAVPLVFPQIPLGLKAELLLNGTWTDISAFLDHDEADSMQHPAAVHITRGRQDETATSPTPQQVTVKAWNGDGRFCSKNPVGAYYPYLQRNTPMRISIPGTTGPSVVTTMQLQSDLIGYASCADSGSLDITGQIDVRVDLVPMALPVVIDPSGYGTGDIGASLAGKWSGVGSGKSWSFALGIRGNLEFWWNDGSSSHFLRSTVPVQIGQRVALRVVFTPSTGVAIFYTAPTMASSWTQLGSTQTFGATTLQAGVGTPVTVGKTPVWQTLAGEIYEMQLYNSSATLVADPVFSAQTAGATSFTDGESNTWTLNGIAQIVTTGSATRDYRFYGQISSLPVTWDPTGNDVWASITASGPLRRLQQGNQPNVYSTMRRFLQSSTGAYAPVALWPCEDAQGSTVLASALPGGGAMVIGGSPELASDTTFACANSLPVINSATFTGKVQPYTATGANVIRFLMSVPAATATPNNAVILQANISGGTCAYVQLTYQTGGFLTFQGFNSSNVSVFTTGSVSFGVNGNPNYVSLEMGTVDGTMQEAIRCLKPGTHTSSFSVGTSITPGIVTQIEVDPGANIPDIALGMLSVQGTAEDMQDLALPVNAWLGEPAGLRVARLCQENNIASRVDGTWGNTVPMGYQIPDTLMNLLQACEDTDRGQLYEPRDFLGVAYRTLDSLTSQSVAVTLDYNQDHMTPPLTPTDDDLYIVNDVTVTNESSSTSFSGSSAQETLNDGSAMSIGVIGDYANSYNVSTASDLQLPDVAGWILQTGTGNDERYPSVIVNLASEQPQVQAISASVEALDIGSYAQIVNTPSFLPPGPARLLVWGYDEYLGDFCNELQYNTIPESVYEVAVADRDRADTPGSTIIQPATSTGTSLTVITNGADTWTTSAGQFPFDLGISGERITATAIASATFFASDSQGFESGIAGWTGGAGGSGSCAVVVSTAEAHAGTHSLQATVSGTPTNAFNSSAFIAAYPNTYYYSGGYVWISGGYASTQWYISFYNSSQQLISGALGPTFNVPSATWTNVYLGLIANPVQSPAGTAYIQYGCNLFGSPSSGTVFYTDDTSAGPLQSQVFTVTRSVNGIVKAHSIGESISLWQSDYAALTA